MSGGQKMNGKIYEGRNASGAGRTAADADGARGFTCAATPARTEKDMNLAALQQRDPYITDIADSATQVALYIYNSGTRCWEKTEVAGTLFVYSRSAHPLNGFMIINRLHPNDLIEPINRSLEFQLQDPFLLYRNSHSAIHGIWFYDKDECARIGQLMNSLVQIASDVQSLIPVSYSISGSVSNSAVIATDGGPDNRLHRSSEPTDTPNPLGHTASNKLPSLDMRKHVDILQMLSKAQDEYDKSRDDCSPLCSTYESGLNACSMSEMGGLIRPTAVRATPGGIAGIPNTAAATITYLTGIPNTVPCVMDITNNEDLPAFTDSKMNRVNRQISLSALFEGALQGAGISSAVMDNTNDKAGTRPLFAPIPVIKDGSSRPVLLDQLMSTHTPQTDLANSQAAMISASDASGMGSKSVSKLSASYKSLDTNPPSNWISDGIYLSNSAGIPACGVSTSDCLSFEHGGVGPDPIRAFSAHEQKKLTVQQIVNNSKVLNHPHPTCSTSAIMNQTLGHGVSVNQTTSSSSSASQTLTNLCSTSLSAPSIKSLDYSFKSSLEGGSVLTSLDCEPGTNKPIKLMTPMDFMTSELSQHGGSVRHLIDELSNDGLVDRHGHVLAHSNDDMHASDASSEFLGDKTTRNNAVDVHILSERLNKALGLQQQSTHNDDMNIRTGNILQPIVKVHSSHDIIEGKPTLVDIDRTSRQQSVTLSHICDDDDGDKSKLPQPLQHHMHILNRDELKNCLIHLLQTDSQFLATIYSAYLTGVSRHSVPRL